MRFYIDYDNMRSEVESVIRQMAETDVKELMPLGIQYGSTLFPERKRAVVKEADCYYLLLPEGSNKNEEFALLTELFSYLRYMEENHIVYVRHSERPVDVLLDGYRDKNLNSAAGEYDLGNGCSLKTEDGTPKILCSDNTTLQSDLDITSLAADIEHFLLAYVYPTAVLHDFIANDYLSKSDFRAKRSISISRISIIVAVIIAVLSPVVTIILGNKYGISTLNKQQFDTLKLIIAEPESKAPDSPSYNKSSIQLCQPLNN
ncbi:MAG: hypothetical protein J5965_20900 [Aeriscardovia sp.]|nr:hypothetical protein [Aeriscardovia sp.]